MEEGPHGGGGSGVCPTHPMGNSSAPSYLTKSQKVPPNPHLYATGSAHSSGRDREKTLLVVRKCREERCPSPLISESTIITSARSQSLGTFLSSSSISLGYSFTSAPSLGNIWPQLFLVPFTIEAPYNVQFYTAISILKFPYPTSEVNACLAQ